MIFIEHLVKSSAWRTACQKIVSAAESIGLHLQTLKTNYEIIGRRPVDNAEAMPWIETRRNLAIALANSFRKRIEKICLFLK